MRKVLALGIVLALIASTVIAAYVLTHPRWTVADCALWANSQSPTLAPNTYTDRCKDVDGVVIWADPNAEHIWH